MADPADVIHVKSMSLSIPYYPRLVERLARILAPGGLLVLSEAEPSYVSLEPSAMVDQSRLQHQARQLPELSDNGTQPLLRRMVPKAVGLCLWSELTLSRCRRTL